LITSTSVVFKNDLVQGQVLAILGPSGCGKTSLVNLLAARMFAGQATGKILINGQVRPQNWSGLTGFVEQDDGEGISCSHLCTGLLI
jgi:ABC-type multidrug transport system ATPase subunit